jgi:hypothetical protein
MDHTALKRLLVNLSNPEDGQSAKKDLLPFANLARDKQFSCVEIGKKHAGRILANSGGILQGF